MTHLLTSKSLWILNSRLIWRLRNYFQQVMKLFEQFDAPDYVIQVAHIALDLAPPDDSNIVSTVYSVTSLLTVCQQWRS